jgi:hypothetical protein
MSDRMSRLAPLTGVVFVVLLVVAIITGGETPESSASPAKVIAYYTTHRSEVETSALLFGLAFLFLVLFAGALRSYLRKTPAAEGLSALVLAGGVLMAVGALLGTGIEYGLAHQLRHLGPQTAQTLSFLSEELFLPVIVGAFILGVSSGLAILRGAQLPKWLGWVVIVLGIVVVIPPASFPALLGFAIWTLVVSILMYLRSGASVSSSTADTPQVLETSGG